MQYGINSMQTLHPAEDIKEFALESTQAFEEASVASLINHAVNTGATAVEYIGSLSDVTIQKLKDKGYTVFQDIDMYKQPIPNKYVISI